MVTGKLWNVSCSHSPVSHLLSCQSVRENPVPLSNTPQSKLTYAPLLDFSSSLLPTGAWAAPEPPPSAGGAHSPQVDWQSSESARSSSGRPTGRYFKTQQRGTVACVYVCVCLHACVCVRVWITAFRWNSRRTARRRRLHTCSFVSPWACPSLKVIIRAAGFSGPSFRLLGVPWRWSKGTRCLRFKDIKINCISRRYKMQIKYLKIVFELLD